MELKRQLKEIANEMQRLVVQLNNRAVTVEVGANVLNSLTDRLHSLAGRLK